MLTGRKAFEGKTQASLIGDILRTEPPPISSVMPTVPVTLSRLVKKCLAKDREARWQSARDLRDELEWIAHGDATATATRTTVTTSSRRRARVGWIAAAAVAAIAISFFAATMGRDRAPAVVTGATMHLEIVTPPGTDLTGFALSPDGRSLVYTASVSGQSQLWLRALDTGVARLLMGSAAETGPFWAPDSRAIAFFSGGQLRRLDLETGLIRSLAPATSTRGGSWGAQNIIVFASGSAGSLSAVSANGGDVTDITRVDRPRQTGHRFPHFLPDGRHFLY